MPDMLFLLLFYFIEELLAIMQARAPASSCKFIYNMAHHELYKYVQLACCCLYDELYIFNVKIKRIRIHIHVKMSIIIFLVHMYYKHSI